MRLLTRGLDFNDEEWFQSFQQFQAFQGLFGRLERLKRLEQLERENWLAQVISCSANCTRGSIDGRMSGPVSFGAAR
jgi:hypothetical protein